MTPEEYRISHPRCRYCVYKKFKHVDMHGGYTCLVKDKYIPEIDGLGKGRGMFCKVYKPKEIDFGV